MMLHCNFCKLHKKLYFWIYCITFWKWSQELSSFESGSRLFFAPDLQIQLIAKKKLHRNDMIIELENFYRAILFFPSPVLSHKPHVNYSDSIKTPFVKQYLVFTMHKYRKCLLFTESWISGKKNRQIEKN